MIKRPTRALRLILVALIAIAAAGCDRNRPSSKESAAKDDVAKPAQTLASLPVPPSDRPPAEPAPPARMSTAEEAEFETWMVKAYLGCWKPPPQPAGSDPYAARVRLAFKPDGSLAKAPKLVNPPSDPALKPQAKSVMQAVQVCNPLAVPAQYRPFYEQWKMRTIVFNPHEAAR